MKWRNSQPTHPDATDEISLLARRIAPATSESYASSDSNIIDPFEHAHPLLRRSLEQATAADPCTPSGFHLTRIRGPVGSIMHAQSDLRSYSGSGELSTSRARADSYPGSSRGGGYHGGGGDLYNAGAPLGADIADNTWMSWL